MKRRTVLRGLAGATALSLAGCLSQRDTDATGPGGGDESDTPSDSTTATPTNSPADTRTATETPYGGNATTDPHPSETPPPTDAQTPSPTPTPATPDEITDRSFSVGDSGCGQQKGGASVSWNHPASTITVDGTIWGNNTCYTAELAGATLENDSLTVTVRATERESAGETTACGQCIVQVDYEATVSFDHGLPSEVTVVHQHDEKKQVVASEEF